MPKTKPHLALVTDRLHPIKRRCNELGISQKELARRLGVTPGTVSRYVNKKVIFCSNDWKTIQLLKVLKVDLDYLMKF